MVAVMSETAMTATLPHDLEKARYFMIEQQIRTWDVLDPKVLRALETIHREDFVPSDKRGLALTDTEIPLGYGHAMMTPKLEARLLQEATLKEGEQVYEVGTGSGYFTALLAARAGHVTTAEIHSDLLVQARKSLKSAGFSNITFKEGDSASAPIGHDQYDLIVLTGSVPVIGSAFFERLKSGGRLLAIEGRFPLMRAVRYDKDAQQLRRRELFETHATPLERAPHVSRFQF
jgi:protein-L-isoaspartate(D-aspartate) O-methyltransferase